MVNREGLSMLIYKPKNKAATEHRGSIARVAFSDPAAPFVILELTDDSTVKGSATADQFTKGTIYRFLGRWIDDDKRGPQFKFDTFVVHAAHGRGAVVKYLTETCEEITAKVAGRIYEKFREAAVHTLRTDHTAVAEACNLSTDLCELASIELQRSAKYEDTRIELFQLFQSRGFYGKLIDVCIDTWGTRAVSLIRKNPFCMLGKPSAGFKRCDKMWIDFGLPKDSRKRTAIVAANLVKTDRNGHTWLSGEDLVSKLRDMIPGADVFKAFKLAIRARLLKKHRDAAGKLWLASYHCATSEERIAASLARLSTAVNLWPTDRIPVSQVEGDRLPSQHQVDRLKRATVGPVGMLLGGPGTGKTHSLAYLLREVIAEYGRSSITVCAPTGKAAVRATQALLLANINLTAHTIHSTLEIGRNGHDGDGWGFLRDQSNPLDCRFLVCDECFVRGTVVDTPNGPKPIESISIGDDVYSAAGIDQVYGVSRKVATSAVRITAGKASFVCSENHPFLTARGWVSACELKPRDSLIQATTAMRLLRGDGFACGFERVTTSLLREFLRREMVESVSRIQSQSSHVGSKGKAGQGSLSISSLGDTRSERAGGTHSCAQPDVEFRDSCKGIETTPRVNRTSTPVASGVGAGVGDRTRCIAGEADAGLSDLLQTRLGSLDAQSGYRDRRIITQRDGEKATGREEECEVDFIEVDSVEVLQQGHPDLDQYRDADGTLYLYDLAVARHPSFSVNGCLVHNCSMNDTDLMADLLDACATGTHVLLIGDPHQLPPVGHGAPLRDMIAAGVPHGELTEVRRNAGQIVHACVRIKNGESFETADKVDLEADIPRNLYLVEARDEAKAREQLVAVLKRLDEKKQRGESGGFDPTWQTQMIVARNTKGEISRKALNSLLHPMLNPDGYSVAGNPFKVGDKIICTRNSRMQQVEAIYTGQADNPDLAKLAENYDVVRDRDQPGSQPVEVYVANGEIGRVVAVAPKLTVARFSEGDALVKIPMGKQRDDEDEGGGEDDGGGKGCNFDLAYAITVHKSQGSESPCIIVMADANAGMIADRNWWYTAISRASKLCLIIGQMGTINRQRVKQAMVRRKTLLVESILEVRYAEL